eukprot:scaffold1008_cov57-Phaeocystis_antarctica.AAC.2
MTSTSTSTRSEPGGGGQHQYDQCTKRYTSMISTAIKGAAKQRTAQTKTTSCHSKPQNLSAGVSGSKTAAGGLEAIDICNASSTSRVEASLAGRPVMLSCRSAGISLLSIAVTRVRHPASGMWLRLRSSHLRFERPPAGSTRTPSTTSRGGSTRLLMPWSPIWLSLRESVSSQGSLFRKAGASAISPASPMPLPSRTDRARGEPRISLSIGGSSLVILEIERWFEDGMLGGDSPSSKSIGMAPLSREAASAEAPGSPIDGRLST